MDMLCIGLHPWWESYECESKVLMYHRKSMVDEYLRSMNSCLKVINCSYKSFTYPIPLASCFGGDYVTHTSHHHHIMRTKHQNIPKIPKLWSLIWARINDFMPFSTTALSLWTMCVTPMCITYFPCTKSNATTTCLFTISGGLWVTLYISWKREVLKFKS